MTIEGRGGDVGQENYGVWIRGGTTITSTGMAAGLIEIHGIGGQSNWISGVVVSGRDTAIMSSTGHIQIEGTRGDAIGYSGVEISDRAKIESTGAGSTAATITIIGRGNDAGGGIGLSLSEATIISRGGDMTLVLCHL